MAFQALEDARRCVGFLFAGVGDDATPVGTCFFATAPRGDAPVTYLVTAKHVLEAMRGAHTGYVRVNTLAGGASRVDLDLGDVWLTHDDLKVDLAICRWLEDDPNDDILPLDLSPSLDGEDLGASDWLRDAEDVAFLGLMRPFAGAPTNLVPLRIGTVALVTNEPIQGHYGASSYHVIQAQTYPANSGSPTWLVIGRSFFFIGVLVFGFPSPDDLRKIEGDDYSFYNLGMSLVTPRERLVEIIRKFDVN